MPPSAQGRDARRTRVIAGFRARNLDQVTADAELMSDLRAEAACADPDKLICGDLLLLANWARRLQEGPPALGLFFSTDDVILVPGVMASELIDVKSDGGVVWVHPLAASDDESAGRTLLSLGLGKYGPGEPDQDASEDVRIMPNGALPVIYSALKFDLDARRYTVQIFGYDWRKSIEESAAVLAGLIRDRLTRPFRPLHIIAHSQGAMVARRSLQLVGTRLARELVSNLVLIAPVTAGTFSIVRALFGDSSLVETIRRFGVTPPRGFSGVLQSMTGVYQLIPYRPESGLRAERGRWSVVVARQARRCSGRSEFLAKGNGSETSALQPRLGSSHRYKLLERPDNHHSRESPDGRWSGQSEWRGRRRPGIRHFR